MSFAISQGNLIGSGPGGGGSGDASAANQLDQLAAEQAIQLAVESIDIKTSTDPSTATNQGLQIIAEEAIRNVLETWLPTLGTENALLLINNNSITTNDKLDTLQASTDAINEKLTNPLPISGAVTATVTDVYSILLGGSGPAAITSVINAKSSAGRVKRIVATYTGLSATTYLQIHKSSNTTVSTSTLLESGIPIGTATPYMVFSPEIDLPCTTGIAIAFSSTQNTYTAAVTETGFLTVYGA